MAEKSKMVELSSIELIGAASGRTITGIHPIDNHDKVSNILRHMTNYEYDNEKSLAENVYAAFPQYKIKEATDKFSSIMKEWIDRGDDLTFINNAITAGFVAAEYDIPQTLHIKVKQEEKAKAETKAHISEQPKEVKSAPREDLPSVSDWKHRNICGNRWSK